MGAFIILMMLLGFGFFVAGIIIKVLQNWLGINITKSPCRTTSIFIVVSCILLNCGVIGIMVEHVMTVRMIKSQQLVNPTVIPYWPNTEIDHLKMLKGLRDLSRKGCANPPFSDKHHAGSHELRHQEQVRKDCQN